MDGLLNAELKGKLIMGRPRSRFRLPTVALQAKVEYANCSQQNRAAVPMQGLHI